MTDLELALHKSQEGIQNNIFTTYRNQLRTKLEAVFEDLKEELGSFMRNRMEYEIYNSEIDHKYVAKLREKMTETLQESLKEHVRNINQKERFLINGIDLGKITEDQKSEIPGSLATSIRKSGLDADTDMIRQIMNHYLAQWEELIHLYAKIEIGITTSSHISRVTEIISEASHHIKKEYQKIVEEMSYDLSKEYEKTLASNIVKVPVQKQEKEQEKRQDKNLSAKNFPPELKERFRNTLSYAGYELLEDDFVNGLDSFFVLDKKTNQVGEIVFTSNFNFFYIKGIPSTEKSFSIDVSYKMKGKNPTGPIDSFHDHTTSTSISYHVEEHALRITEAEKNIGYKIFINEQGSIHYRKVENGKYSTQPEEEIIAEINSKYPTIIADFKAAHLPKEAKVEEVPPLDPQLEEKKKLQAEIDELEQKLKEKKAQLQALESPSKAEATFDAALAVQKESDKAYAEEAIKKGSEGVLY